MFRHGQWVLFEHKPKFAFEVAPARMEGDKPIAAVNGVCDGDQIHHNADGRCVGIYQAAGFSSKPGLNGASSAQVWLPESVIPVDGHGRNIRVPVNTETGTELVQAVFAADSVGNLEALSYGDDIPESRLASSSEEWRRKHPVRGSAVV